MEDYIKNNRNPQPVTNFRGKPWEFGKKLNVYEAEIQYRGQNWFIAGGLSESEAKRLAQETCDKLTNAIDTAFKQLNLRKAQE